MIKYLLLILLFTKNILVDAQPIIDLVSIKYSNSPDAGLVRRNYQANRFTNFNLNINLPIVFKKDSSALVISQFAELWNIKKEADSFLPNQFQSFALQLTYIKPITPNWTITISAIPRWNGYDGHLFDESFQMGAALIATCRRSSNLKYKFGVYYNSEFSGAFFIPLLGIDWRLDNRNNVYGMLPGNLIWEHKVSNRFYYGCNFKAITNSYRAGNISDRSYYLRIDDNQLHLFSDFYCTKKIVVTIETGHSFFRQLRLGYNNGKEKYFQTQKANDNFLIKAGIAYRLRL